MKNNEAPNPSRRYARDPLASALWLQINAATGEYELLLASGQQPDPLAFAELYPNIPSGILLPELKRLLDEHIESLTPLQRLQLIESSSPTSLPSNDRYSELEPIGSGGMGEVFQGIDNECFRKVAIKKIKKEQRFNPDAQKRFKTEIELTAELEHPGIIPVYGKGIDAQGREFYAMRLINGDGAGTLEQAIESLRTQLVASKNRWRTSQVEQLRDLVRRLIAVTDTIAYAHSRGIVHRDLKPANILLGAYGETLISDWGLARRIDRRNSSKTNKPTADSVRRTSSDAVSMKTTSMMQTTSSTPDQESVDELLLSDVTTGLGTPGYSAPELEQSPSLKALPLCDVYSIGAILMVILSGKKPERKPVRLYNKWRSPALSALEAIGCKATAEDLQQRYANVTELRSDLLNWIAGEPLIAFPEGFIERAIRWPNRHRVATAGIATALLITISAGALILWLQSKQSKVIESKAGQLAEALEKANSLLEETRQAKLAAEKSQQIAEQRQREATDSRRLAEKRGSIAFEGLLKFQELAASNQEVFQSPELAQLNDSLSEQSKEIFASILADLEAESPPSPRNLVRLTEVTHRLAATEAQLNKDDEAYALFNRTCEWMRRFADTKDLPSQTKLLLQLQIGKLRSLQGLLSIRVGRNQLAKPQLEESIRRLEPMLNEEQLSVEERSTAATAMAASISAISMQDLFAGNPDNAKALQQRAMAILSDHAPITYEDAMVRVQVHGNMSRIYEKLSEPNKSLSELAIAADQAELAEGMIAQRPGGIGGRQTVVRPTNQHVSLRAEIAQQRAKLLVAKKDYRAAINLLKKLLEKELETLLQFPSDPRCLASYQATASSIEPLLIQSGDNLSAITFLEAWEKLAQDLLRRNAPTEANLQFLVVAFHSAGHAFEKLEQRDLALEKYQSAIQICDQAELLRFRSAANCSQRIELELHRFLLRLPTSAWEEVESHFDRAVRAAEELKALPASAGNLVTIARTQLSQGLAAMRSAERETEAAAWEAKLEKLQLNQPSAAP
jgi:serine/threonine protein kinase